VHGVSTLLISTPTAATSIRTTTATAIKITLASNRNRRYNSKDPAGTTQAVAITQGISVINRLQHPQVSRLTDIFSRQASCDQGVPRNLSSIRQLCIRIGHKRVHRRSSQSINSRLQWDII